MSNADFPKTEKMMPKSNRALILRSLVPIASSVFSEHLQVFLLRLTEALRQHSQQKSRPVEALLCESALGYIKKNSLQFYATAPGYLTHLLIDEIDLTENKFQKKDTDNANNPASLSFDEIEKRAAIQKLSQAVEHANAEVLDEFNKRVAYLLQSRTIAGSRNPFRPETFIQALYDAWCDFYVESDSHNMVLRLLRAETFSSISAILQILNEALIARRILVDQANESAPANEVPDNPITRHQGGKESLHQKKLRQLLPDEESSMGDLLIPNLFPVAKCEDERGEVSVHGIATTLQRRMYLDVSDDGAGGKGEATILHNFKNQMQPGLLTQNQHSAVELLISIYEYIFANDGIHDEIKALIAPLQIPTLKAALLNKDFFFKETHPARHLLEILFKASIFWNPDGGTQDPLYLAIKNSVDQLKYEEEPSSDLFAAVASEFESFVSEETGWSEIALTEPIAEALRQEKIRLSHDKAMAEVEARIDTGEIAGFVEKFLEMYWVPVLALAYSVKDDKPDALDNALKTMDDLIWSMKPKANPEERKELIAKLPSLLSLTNAWLNTIKCDEQERAVFFMKLAERHASIVRADFTLRGQIEFAVNVAEKVSDRRLQKNSHVSRGKSGEKFTVLANGLMLGDCVEFLDENDVPKKFKLAWMSAKRSILLFSNHQGRDAFSVTVDDLAHSFLIERARILVWTPIIERALSAALAEIDAKAEKHVNRYFS